MQASGNALLSLEQNQSIFDKRQLTNIFLTVHSLPSILTKALIRSLVERRKKNQKKKIICVMWSRWPLKLSVSHQYIIAGGTILARRCWKTLVDFLRTIFSFVSLGATALVIVDQIHAYFILITNFAYRERVIIFY